LQERFWTHLWRVFSVVVSVVTLGLAIFASRAAAASFFGGAAISFIALIMIRYTAGAYVRTGLEMADGGSPASGRMVRGLLLVARMGIVCVLLAGLVSWKSVNVFALIGGVASVQVALVITAVLSTLGWDEKG